MDSAKKQYVSASDQEEQERLVAMVSSIADQTNLLAMNAAIEAARAGGNGKGFEIVAEELRQLAVESQKAARQIVDIVEEGCARSENLRALSERLSTGVNSALRDVQSLSRLARDISA